MGKRRTTVRRTASRPRHEVSLFPAPDSVAGQQYYYVTRRPWPSLLFVLPLLLFAELGAYRRRGVAGSGTTQLVATYLIDQLAGYFGRSAFFIPGLCLVAILLAIHLVGKHPWKFDAYVIPAMLGESLLWTIPLFVLDRVLHVDRVLHTAARTGGSSAYEPWVDGLIRSFGAGLYEELVFRLICITVLVILLVDVCKLPASASAVFIVLASTALFAAQHHPPLGAEPFNAVEFAFRAAAGLYLAGLFIFRGFGIAAGCHSFYNAIVVTVAAVAS